MANKSIDITDTIINKNKLTIPLSSVGLSGNTNYEVNVPSGVLKKLDGSNADANSMKMTTGVSSIPCVVSTSVNYTTAPGYDPLTYISNGPYVKYVTNPVCKVASDINTDAPSVGTNIIQIEFHMTENMKTTSGGGLIDLNVYDLVDDSSIVTFGGAKIKNDIVYISIPINNLISNHNYYILLTQTSPDFFVNTNFMTNESGTQVTDITALQNVFKDYPKYIFTYNG